MLQHSAPLADLTSEITVSVIVLNWNGERLLSACLRSIREQTLPGIETILVDNGSTDGSLALVAAHFPEVRIIALRTNLGFSAGNNAGIRNARGRYVALLNNDAQADPRWIEELVHALEQRPEVASCASKILRQGENSIADACGDFYTSEGIPGKIGHLESADRYNESREVFGACAGAALYRRALLDQLGGFDEDFFIVHEDNDLSFRFRLHGYRCVYVPTAVVYHLLSASIGYLSDTAVYYAQRNMEFIFFKNMPTVLLLKYLPLHVVTNLLLFARYILHGQARVFLKAKLDALAMMPKMLSKRREIQGASRVPAAEIDRLLLKGYLWGKLRQGLRGNSGKPPFRSPGNRA